MAKKKKQSKAKSQRQTQKQTQNVKVYVNGEGSQQQAPQPSFLGSFGGATPSRIDTGGTVTPITPFLAPPVSFPNYTQPERSFTDKLGDVVAQTLPFALLGGVGGRAAAATKIKIPLKVPNVKIPVGPKLGNAPMFRSRGLADPNAVQGVWLDDAAAATVGPAAAVGKAGGQRLGGTLAGRARNLFRKVQGAVSRAGAAISRAGSSVVGSKSLFPTVPKQNRPIVQASEAYSSATSALDKASERVKKAGATIVSSTKNKLMAMKPQQKGLVTPVKTKQTMSLDTERKAINSMFDADLRALSTGLQSDRIKHFENTVRSAPSRKFEFRNTNWIPMRSSNQEVVGFLDQEGNWVFNDDRAFKKLSKAMNEAQQPMIDERITAPADMDVNELLARLKQTKSAELEQKLNNIRAKRTAVSAQKTPLSNIKAMEQEEAELEEIYKFAKSDIPITPTIYSRVKELYNVDLNELRSSGKKQRPMFTSDQSNVQNFVSSSSPFKDSKTPSLLNPLTPASSLNTESAIKLSSENSMARAEMGQISEQENLQQQELLQNRYRQIKGSNDPSVKQLFEKYKEYFDDLNAKRVAQNMKKISLNWFKRVINGFKVNKPTGMSDTEFSSFQSSAKKFVEQVTPYLQRKSKRLIDAKEAARSQQRFIDRLFRPDLIDDVRP